MSLVKNRKASCHTDKPYHAKGLCVQCYTRKMNSRPEQRAKARARMKDWVKKNPQRSRDLDTIKHLRRVYGISIDEYRAMCERQNNKCALCKKPETVINKRDKSIMRLSVDHCHVTGRIRGALCRACNMMLSRFEKNPDIYLNIHNYLGPDFVKENKIN